MIEVSGIHAGYGPVKVLRGIDFSVQAGEVLAVVGPNGAGKSTMLNACVGLIPRQGVVKVDGAVVPPRDIPGALERGMAIVPEARQLFGDLSIEENILLGSYMLLRRRGSARRNRQLVAHLREECESIFPILASRRTQLARTLSGGEQQMVAIARAVMSNPKVLLLDEPTLGLAPVVVGGLLESLRRIAAERAVVIVEQDLGLITSLATRALHLDEGRVRKATTGTTKPSVTAET